MQGKPIQGLIRLGVKNVDDREYEIELKKLEIENKRTELMEKDIDYKHEIQKDNLNFMFSFFGFIGEFLNSELAERRLMKHVDAIGMGDRK